MLPDFVTPGSNGSIWRSIAERSEGSAIRKEDMFNTFIFRESADNIHLTVEEKRDLEILLRALHDAPSWRNGLLSLDSIGRHVVLSDKRKTYLELFAERKLLPDKEEDWDEEMVKVIQSFRVLGEYQNGIIILYINNIKETANETSAPGFYDLPYLTVTRYVYLHELMHEYFERKENEGYKYNREQEEAFAEFGALLLLGRLVKTNHRINHASKEELEWAIRHVEGKRGALECYSRGAGLFRRFGQDEKLAGEMLAAYPKLSFPDLV